MVKELLRRHIMFMSMNDFSIYIEELKMKMEFDTYMETIVYFYENETDHEMEDIAKMLNQKIKNNLHLEAMERGMMKENNIVQIQLC